MSENPDYRDDLGAALIDVHGSYRSQRLLHEPPDERISDAVTWAAIKPHAIRFALFYVLFLIIFPFYLVANIGSAASSGIDSLSGRTSSASGFLHFLSVVTTLLMVALVIAWLVSLFMPVREQIAEYGLLIEGRAGAASSAYGWVMTTAQRRRAPFEIRVGKVIGIPTLKLTTGRVRAMVIVRTVGVDLYVGWTMWRARSTVVLIGNLLRDTFRRLTEASDAAVDLRGSTARALRELVHSLTREGIQAALLQVDIGPALQHQIDTLPDLDAVVSALGTVGNPGTMNWSQPQPSYPVPPQQPYPEARSMRTAPMPPAPPPPAPPAPPAPPSDDGWPPAGGEQGAGPA